MRDEAGAIPRTRPVCLVARAAAIGVVIGAIAIAAGAPLTFSPQQSWGSERRNSSTTCTETVSGPLLR
jgi:hypothetical protein